MRRTLLRLRDIYNQLPALVKEEEPRDSGVNDSQLVSWKLELLVDSILKRCRQKRYTRLIDELEIFVAEHASCPF